MLTLTSELESDSFLSETLGNGKQDDKTSVELGRRALDVHEEKLNEIATSNRQLMYVESQLARLRSELEKSEMLRQTLEYELTLLRTQHGKQHAFTTHLQTQFNQATEQIKQLQSEIAAKHQTKDEQLKEKDEKIKQLEKQAELYQDRERRVEALNEQIHKMEKAFSDSENLSRQNLAQSILAKEREAEFKREYEVLRVKLEFTEQTLEQERAISNEAKLNVQLLTNRLSDMENKCETLSSNCLNQQRKIDQLEKQAASEKLLRTTLTKIQADLELNCTQTQKLTMDYEKQLKQLRDELANYRRKFRNNEDKYNQMVQKVFEYLRMSKIIPDSTTMSQSEGNFPTVKQLEELKIFIELLKNSKVEQTNEINRLKKAIERLNRNSVSQKQLEHQTEVNRDKLQNELEECREKKTFIEETLQRSKVELEYLIKENEKKNVMLNLIDSKLKIIVGSNNSTNIEKNLNELEKQWKNLHVKIKSLEDKLVERDTGTLQLTQKLEEQVLHLKQDADQRHNILLAQKNQLLQTNQAQIQNLTVQLQKMETRINEYELMSKQTNQSTKKLTQEKEKLELILKHLVSILVPLRHRYLLMIESNRFLKQEFVRYNQIKDLLQGKDSTKNKTFRTFAITVIASKRLAIRSQQFSIKSLHSSHSIFDQCLLSSLNPAQFLQSIHSDDVFQSLFIQLNQLYSPFTRGSLIKFIARPSSASSSSTKIVDRLQSLLVRLDQSESRVRQQEIECSELRKKFKSFQSEIDSRIDYEKFERICNELERALDREKQAQELLNEQNNQLKSLTDILHETQREKDIFQEKFNEIIRNDKYSKEKIQQLTKTQQQMDENVKRAEKAIRLVVNDKEQISAFCNRLNLALNANEKRGIENIDQMISQLEALVQMPLNVDETNDRAPPEVMSCQSMAIGFVNLLNRLRCVLASNRKDIDSLKEHCQLLTEQFRQFSEREPSPIDSTRTIIVQAHPVRLQVNHHPQSAFKPIRPQQQDEVA